MARGLFIGMTLLWVLASSGRCDPAWLAGVEKDIAAPGSGAKAVATLEALPLPERQTRDYHWALARAYQADNKPMQAGEAVAVFGLLPPATPDRDVSDVEKWLKKTAADQYKAAVAAQAKKDNANAVKAYLRAIMLDSGIQAKDDHGLAELGMRVLGNAVAKKPADTTLRFKHALCCYLFGRLSEAAASFNEYVKLEKAPYPAWRAKLWQDKVGAELSASKAQDAQSAAADKARHEREDKEAALAAARSAATAATAKASPGAGDAGAGDAAAEGGDRKTQIQAEIAKIDQDLAAANAAAGAAANYGGKAAKIAGQLLNGGNMDQMRARRTQLQNELNGLK